MHIILTMQPLNMSDLGQSFCQCREVSWGFFCLSCCLLACSLLPCLSLFLNVNLVCHYRVTVKRCGCSVWQHVYSRCIFVLKARCNVSSQGKEEWPLVCLGVLRSVLPFLFPVRLKTCWWWLKVLRFLLSLNFFFLVISEARRRLERFSCIFLFTLMSTKNQILLHFTF